MPQRCCAPDQRTLLARKVLKELLNYVVEPHNPRAAPAKTQVEHRN